MIDFRARRGKGGKTMKKQTGSKYEKKKYIK